MYEALNPVLSPSEKTNPLDPRIGKAKKFIKAVHYISPQVRIVHPLNATGPDECLKLIENTFISPHFLLYFHAPTYLKWLIDLGMHTHTAIYEYHRKQLQIIGQGETQSRLVLKAPIHLFFLDALLKVYPDASIVHLHRDPKSALPSFCSLVAVSRSIGSDDARVSDIGRFAMDLYELSNEYASLARRKSDNPRQFYDVEYQDLIDDPNGIVEKIYNHFDYNADPSMEEKTSSWLTNNPQHKHGIHRYSMDTFNIDTDRILLASNTYKKHGI